MAPTAVVPSGQTKPIAGAIFAQQFEAPAWKEVPSWYLVATRDNAINPELQHFFAKRMTP